MRFICQGQDTKLQDEFYLTLCSLLGSNLQYLLIRHSSSALNGSLLTKLSSLVSCPFVLFCFSVSPYFCVPAESLVKSKCLLPLLCIFCLCLFCPDLIFVLVSVFSASRQSSNQRKGIWNGLRSFIHLSLYCISVC